MICYWWLFARLETPLQHRQHLSHINLRNDYSCLEMKEPLRRIDVQLLVEAEMSVFVPTTSQQQRSESITETAHAEKRPTTPLTMNAGTVQKVRLCIWEIFLLQHLNFSDNAKLNRTETLESLVFASRCEVTDFENCSNQRGRVIALRAARPRVTQVLYLQINYQLRRESTRSQTPFPLLKWRNRLKLNFSVKVIPVFGAKNALGLTCR